MLTSHVLVCYKRRASWAAVPARNFLPVPFEHIVFVQRGIVFFPGNLDRLVGQCGEFQHSQGFPTQLAHGGSGLLSADEPPCLIRAAPGVTVSCSGDTEGVGVGNGFTQQINQGVADARVFETS